MEKMDLIVAEMRRQLETMEESIEEPRSGGDGVREEMQTVSDSTVDVVQENMENEARGELQKPTQRRTFKEIVANLRDKNKLPRNWKCYFCEGEHWSSECPQRLILLARIQKWENEKEWEYPDSDSDSDSDSEEEEEISPTQVSTEDMGSEPHLDIIEEKHGPTTEGIVPKEIEEEEGLIAGGAVPMETQLILVEDQDSLHDDLPSRREEKEGPTMEEVMPMKIPSMLGEFQDVMPTLMDSLELGKHQKELNDWRIYSNAPMVVQERSNHSRPENFKKTRLQKSERGKERKKTLLQLRNFHEEKT